MRHMIRQRVSPALIGVTLAAAGFLAVPGVGWASGGSHGGGRAAAGPVRAHAPAPGRAGSIARVRPPGRSGIRPIAVWPAAWYGVGYPYDAGPYAPPVLPAPTDYSYLDRSQVNGPANQSTYSPPPSGWLELPLAQGSAQVYIDGYYAGEVSDFNRPGGRAVEPGPHHVEIRAPGYQTSSFDVRLQPDQPVAYREDLRPVSGTETRGAAAPTSVASGATFYVIAGCYMGNVPPAQAGPLPPGCDLDQVQTIEIRRP